MKCVITGENPHLRFKLGEKVECKTEKGWQKGRVIGLWDGDMPYRVELTDQEVEVNARFDDDALIRLQKE